MPSIQLLLVLLRLIIWSFKPCYNWNAFNTYDLNMVVEMLQGVLNLIISGIPSIPKLEWWFIFCWCVLNLIISGMPSIPMTNSADCVIVGEF